MGPVEYSICPQELIVQQHGYLNMHSGDTVQDRIRTAKTECKQLYDQINRIKGKIQDTQLMNLSHGVDSLHVLNLQPVRTLKGHNDKISDVKWSQDSKSILSSSQDGFMIIWDPFTGLKKSAIPLLSQWVLASAISPRGDLVASAGLDNHCSVYRVSKENTIQQNVISIFKGHTCYISATEFLNERTILTASGDMTCAMWDIPKSKRVTEFIDHLGDVLTMDLPPADTSRYGQNFITGGSDGYAYLWDVRQPNSVQSFFVSDSDISSIKFFKNGESFMTGSDDGNARLFDLRSDCQISAYSFSDGMHQQRQQQQAYPRTQRIRYGSSSSSSSSYPIVKTPQSMNFKESYIEDQGIISIDFSSSGRLMYACYADYGCAIWDIVKGEMIGKVDGHRNRINAVKTSPDGMAVVSSSWDMTLKLWTPRHR
ncbi:unnamed protein product [Kluyveromyces dobzhanskii CBS 2104]|uniref:WGS project CCBQ000000000 data, contig 00104 n=1 Tax=Kluyveromyces dobzhanskii CBS 2104 TaxID=1427455 RepID=A0A0A8L3E6_9SACH|nr:unnamed protein product [Kluyveromyces dobzhanskii CBS 2104]